MKNIAVLISSMTLSMGALAQTPAEDKKAIKDMCGCYHITFDYAETFSPDTSYRFKDPYHAEAAAEWIFAVEETPEKLVLQHLLVVNDTMIIKHWRQDWVYENTDFYLFHADRTWNYESVPAKAVKGQWTQKVYQVDDSPRYEGTATWIHTDGKHYWEGTADSPLPRREFTKRSDYNVMQRTNRHEITDYGWVHEQDNLKLIREGEEDKLVAEEKGYNKYYKIDRKNCEPAIDWWEANAEYWALVRETWDKVLAKNENIMLAKKVDDKLLYQALFSYRDQSAKRAKSEPEAVRKEIEAIITQYTQFPSERGTR